MKAEITECLKFPKTDGGRYVVCPGDIVKISLKEIDVMKGDYRELTGRVKSLHVNSGGADYMRLDTSEQYRTSESMVYIKEILTIVRIAK